MALPVTVVDRGLIKILSEIDQSSHDSRIAGDKKILSLTPLPDDRFFKGYIMFEYLLCHLSDLYLESIPK